MAVSFTSDFFLCDCCCFFLLRWALSLLLICWCCTRVSSAEQPKGRNSIWIQSKETLRSQTQSRELCFSCPTRRRVGGRGLHLGGFAVFRKTGWPQVWTRRPESTNWLWRMPHHVCLGRVATGKLEFFPQKKSEDENNMSYITLFLEDTRANWESPSDINEESGWRKTFPIFLLPSHEHTHCQIPPGCCYLFGFFRRTSIFFTAGAEPNKTVNKRCFSYLCSRMALGKGEKWLEVDTWKGFFSGKILLP